MDLTSGFEAAWVNVMTFLPKLAAFLVILLIGYFVAKVVCRLVDKLLERVRFDGLVERGGVKQALSRTGWDVSDILAKCAYWAILLFTLQLAFGVFGPNPVSDLLTRIIAFIPNIFVAIVIMIVAAAVASGVKNLITASIGGLRFGPMLARLASVLILVTAVFAALDQLEIAPMIVTGLFYAALAVLVGSAIVAIGGGGIEPMRKQWERVMGKVEEEAPKLAKTSGSANVSRETAARARKWRDLAHEDGDYAVK
ncbi:MAG: mechanosensitive ion channel family protein [Verrucomicrobiales bacterium]